MCSTFVRFSGQGGELSSLELSQTEIVTWVNLFLRKWCHDSNNALFVAKGFMEEMVEDLTDQQNASPAIETEKNLDTAAAVLRALTKLEDQVQKMRLFAKDELFDHTGVAKPNP
jgi:hypothetical protein